jgi:hypothetical protein
MADVLAPSSRKWDTGLEKPYRELPSDFREVFLRLGQDRAIEEHYRTNWRVIRRWIEEAGGDELRAERAAITGSSLKPQRRSPIARRYVMGLRLRRHVAWPCRAPRFWDVGLVPQIEAKAPERPQVRRLSGLAALRIIEAAAADPRIAPELRAGMAKAAELVRAEMMEEVK